MEKEKIMKRTFKIPVSWEMAGEIEVEASNIEEALEIAEDTKDEIALPTGYYLDDSFIINDDIDYIKSINDIED